MKANKEKWEGLGTELKYHLPFSVFSVAVGLGVLGLMSSVMGEGDFSQASYSLFHVFHPVHMLFSSMATTAMFWRHERILKKAIAIGIIGAVGVCGLSDILMPFYSGKLLGVTMHWHVCIVEDPLIVLPFVIVGICLGLLVPEVRTSTIFSHSAHVLISSMSSILYLVSFGLSQWTHLVGMVFLYMILAVIVPCCLSDIVFPFLLAEEKEGNEEHTHNH